MHTWNHLYSNLWNWTDRWIGGTGNGQLRSLPVRWKGVRNKWWGAISLISSFTGKLASHESLPVPLVNVICHNLNATILGAFVIFLENKPSCVVVKCKSSHVSEFSLKIFRFLMLKLYGKRLKNYNSYKYNFGKFWKELWKNFYLSYYYSSSSINISKYYIVYKRMDYALSECKFPNKWSDIALWNTIIGKSYSVLCNIFVFTNIYLILKTWEHLNWMGKV